MHLGPPKRSNPQTSLLSAPLIPWWRFCISSPQPITLASMVILASTSPRFYLIDYEQRACLSSNSFSSGSCCCLPLPCPLGPKTSTGLFILSSLSGSWLSLLVSIFCFQKQKVRPWRILRSYSMDHTGLQRTLLKQWLMAKRLIASSTLVVRNLSSRFPVALGALKRRSPRGTNEVDVMLNCILNGLRS